MELTITNLLTNLRGTATEHGWLMELLTFEDTKAGWIRRRTGRGTGTICLLRGNGFPTGLLPQVWRKAQTEGMPIVLTDTRKIPCPWNAQADVSFLRPDQCEALETIKNRRRGIVKFPTGGGKSVIAAAMAMGWPCRWLFLVNQADLMHQMAACFKEFTGEEAGRIGDGMWEERRFTAATFQTLYKAIGTPRAQHLLNSVEGVIVDESHTLPAASYMRVMGCTRNAYFRIGLSATPMARGDRRSIFAVASLGPLIHETAAAELIDQGLLARPEIVMTTIRQGSACPTWQGVYGELVVRSTARNKAVVSDTLRAAKPCVVFTKELKHGRYLEMMLQRSGLRTALVQGDKPTPERRKAIERLERGDLDVIVSSVVFQVGVDIPSLASIVNAAAGRSAIATIQRLGRGSRTDNGRKDSFELYDYYDHGNKIMERWSRERLKSYRAEGYEVDVPSFSAGRT